LAGSTLDRGHRDRQRAAPAKARQSRFDPPSDGFSKRVVGGPLRRSALRQQVSLGRGARPCLARAWRGNSIRNQSRRPTFSGRGRKARRCWHGSWT